MIEINKSKHQRRSIMKKFCLWLTCLSAIGVGPLNAIAFGDKGKIPVVGINEKGEQETIEITQEEYKQKAGAAALTVYDSIMPVLKQEEPKPSKWGMRVVGVGLGVTAEFGIGPVKVGAIPKLRLIFTNHTNPPLP
jgi:hypothetical protein